MEKNNARAIYKQLKKSYTQYDETIHCPLVLQLVGMHGRISEFCMDALISDSTFWNWTRKYPLFQECFRIAKMFALEKWEKEGENGRYNPEFNTSIWTTQGNHWFGLGKTARIRLDIDDGINPWEQYQQIMKQATMGEFTSAELKQIMESINIGLRSHEAIKMQEEMDKMKQDLKLMNQNHANNVTAITRAKKKDKDTVHDKICKTKDKP